MSLLVNKIFQIKDETTDNYVENVSFGNYKLRSTILSLPLPMARRYTSEDVKMMCERLNADIMNKYCLGVIGGKIINKYLFIRAGNLRSQGNTKYIQLDLDTFETVNVWEANEFPETIEIGEYDA